MHLVDCTNCGQQTMVNGPEDNCQFCDKNASKKEVIMPEPEKMTNKVEGVGVAIIKEMMKPVPPRPKKRKQLRQYYEQNREAILADYNSMTLLPFYRRWHISTKAWMGLKTDWSVQGKHKAHASKKVVALASTEEAPVAPESIARSVDAPLTEHEHYLVLLGWQQAAREFLRAGKDQR